MILNFYKYNENVKNTENDIENIILELIDEYGEMYNDGPSDINEGRCDKFAEDLLEKLGGKNENQYIIEVLRDLGGSYNGWFKDSNGKYKFEKYGKLPNNLLIAVEKDIDKFNNKYNRWLNEKNVGIDKFKVSDHYWVYYNGKHYDAESPKGKYNMFNLPIFKRYINNFIKKYK